MSAPLPHLPGSLEGKPMAPAVFVGLGGPVAAERDQHGNERLGDKSWRRAGLQTKGLRGAEARLASDDEDGELAVEPRLGPPARSSRQRLRR